MSFEHTSFAKGFSQYETKKLGYRAICILLIMGLTLYIFFNLPLLILQQSMASSLEMILNFQQMGKPSEKCSQIDHNQNSIHNLSSPRSDVYEINGDIRVDNNASTVFTVSNSEFLNTNSSWKMTPYARKPWRFGIREWKINISKFENVPNCDHQLNTPAILFSTGAFSRNYFHSMTDLLIPLYMTSFPFKGNVIFLITNYNSSWKTKYTQILNTLSDYEVMDIDNENQVLCFSKLIIGLKSNRELGIDPLLPPYFTMSQFKQFLRKTYLLPRETVNDGVNNHPRVIIISRKRNRVLINEDEVAEMARDLGFNVVVKGLEGNVSLIAQSSNSFDVMIGVHGAGLTNMVYLPQKAVVIQIIPFALDYASKSFFETPAKKMGLRYLDYKVSINESSLFGKYPSNSEVYTNPNAIHAKGTGAMYWVHQDVNIDLVRFRRTLLKALQILHD